MQLLKKNRKTMLLYGCCSDTGLKRSENQDFYGKFPETNADLSDAKGQLFIVADGIGGHAMGADASKMAVTTIQEVYFSDNSPDIAKSLKRAFETANREIYLYSGSVKNFRKMGTTCTAIVITQNRAYIGHVGDSRAYRINRHKIKQMTRDHTQVAEMYRRGLLTKEEAENHPNRSVIERALGVKHDLDIDIISDISFDEGEYFVLCTDGLVQATPQEIQKVVLTNSPQSACKLLIQLANLRGGHDNTTVIVIQKAPVTYAQDASEKFTPAPSKWLNRVTKILLCLLLGLIGFLILRDHFFFKKNDVPQYDQQKSHDPDDQLLKSKIDKASSHYEAGELDSALACYQSIIITNPGNASAEAGLHLIAESFKMQADTCYRNSSFDQALVYYRKAEEIDPSDQYLQEMIAVCSNQLTLTPPPDSILSQESVKEAMTGTETSNKAVMRTLTPGKKIIDSGFAPPEWFLGSLNKDDYTLTASSLTFSSTQNPKMALAKKPLSDIVVSVKAQILYGNMNRRYGMVLGYNKIHTKGEEYYLYTVKGLGQFELRSITPAGETLIAVGSKIPMSLEPLRPIHLSVKCVGQWLILYANDRFVNAWSGDKLIVGSIGLFADPNLEIEFSNLKIEPAIATDHN